MDLIVVKGVPPYDGEWGFDLEARELTTREWGWIKRLAGYLPAALGEQAMGDPELVTVLAAIVLRRNGKIDHLQVPMVFDRLSDAPFGAAITLETDRQEEEEADAGPPLPRSTGNGDGSGRTSPASSETSPQSPNSSGIPASATSPSVPPRSGN